jgi:hypothetical protein
MKNPVAFALLTLVVLIIAGLIFHQYALPLLNDDDIGCRLGGGIKLAGCSTSFGTFMMYLTVGVALAVAVIWTLFGR